MRINLNNSLLKSLFIILLFSLFVVLSQTGVSFAAIKNTVTLADFSYSYYADGSRAGYNQHGVFKGSLGNPVFCGNHTLPSPIGASLGKSITFDMHEYDDEAVRKILYYGYGGPKEWEGFSEKKYNGVYKAYSTEQKRDWCGIAVTAMAITETQNRGTVYNISGYDEFWDYIDEAPSAPEGFKAYIMYGKSNEQNLFTWIYEPVGKLSLEKEVSKKEGIYINDSVKGAVYGVYKMDGELIAKLTTKEDGASNTLTLKTGKYYVKELSAPKGFLIDDQVYNIEIKEDKTTKVTSMEEPTQTKIIKCDDTAEQNQISGAKLELLDEAGNKICDWISGSEGVVLLGLEPGKYILQELQPPKGYVKAEPIVIEIIETKELQSYYLTNNKQKVYFTIYKDFEKDEFMLLSPSYENVKFGVFSEAGVLIEEIEFDENGKGEFLGELDEGRYYLKELKTEAGYILDKEKYFFDVEYDMSGEEVMEIPMFEGKPLVNSYVKCSIMIIKEDAETGEALENVGFALYNCEGVEIASGYTDVNGTISFENLPIGNYSFKEIKPKEGYVLDSEVYSVSLSEAERISNNRIANTKIYIPEDPVKETPIEETIVEETPVEEEPVIKIVPKTGDNQEKMMYMVVFILFSAIVNIGYFSLKNSAKKVEN